MTIRKLCSGLVVLVILCVFAMPVMADRDAPRKRDRDIRERPRVVQQQERRDRRYYEKRGYKLDTRYRHNHYYPPRGYVERTLPRPYRIVPYRGTSYYFHSGIWYRRSGVTFSVVIPPVGLVVPVLPPYYTTIWVGAAPYYYAGGVYYVWRPAMNGYMVVSEPKEESVNEEASVPEELFVYPKQGQSEQQQETDRYECYRWAVGQTSFDPTQPGGGVPSEQHATKHADYQRALKACLEGRGYSVR